MIFYFLFILLLLNIPVVINGLLKLPKSENGKPRLLVENWKNNVVYLVQYPRIESLPNLSIKCLLVESWLKIKNVQFFRINNHFLLGSPDHGTVPFVQFNGDIIEGSDKIIKNLDHFGQKLKEDTKEKEIIGIVDETLIPDAALAPMRDCLRSTNNLHADYEERKEARKKILQKPDLTIRMCHFETAIQKMKPSVTQSTVQKYINWMEEFGSK